MKLKIETPKKSLNKAFLKQRPLKSQVDTFKNNLKVLLDKINIIDQRPKDESEEHLKNDIRDFLRDTYYKETNAINTKDKKDLVIHVDKTTDSKVGIIIEAKRPSNVSEMLSVNKPNTKALHELVLYFMRERVDAGNIDLKYLIATNIHEWYIIEASYFERHFYKNRQFVKDYEEWRDGKKVTKDTNLFYNEIAKPFIDKIDEEITCTYFNIRNYEKELKNNDTTDDKVLIALLKILSPNHLLKVPFSNDSNELDQNFYKELLHVIGLEEVKDGAKDLIQRKKTNRQEASLLEKIIEELKTEGLHKVPDIKTYGETKDEQEFNIALELSITWINRILFLKLLEGQLVNYHKGDRKYKFLNSETIPNYDELFKLFHKVLAVDTPDRTPAALKEKYSLVPYLNSSLFEISELEDLTIKINALDNSDTLEYINSTILKEQKKKNEKLHSLDYLFKFLDSYDFSSEGTEDIQDDNKTLINASVLGKVFEKINGYKDGSIFTPGFITMYMCRESIRSVVLNRFNEIKGWSIKTFDDLYNKIDDLDEANTIINSIKICDPAVGSGHFLVSALNEIIAIKSELRILRDTKNKRLKEYSIEVVNDEIIITDEDGEIFEYNPLNEESQRVQETLFNEKRTLIENCLFGVDINPNSVKICRLRLWIELLKNAYYRKRNNQIELETLPNIDINIKCGNSLLSRFSLDSDLKPALQKSKKTIQNYRDAVSSYKNSTSKDDKRELLKIINDFKNNLVIGISQEDKKIKELNRKRSELFLLTTDDKLLDVELVKGGKKLEKEKINKLNSEIASLELQIEDQKNNIVFKNAFEWRFEFPEILNNSGDYVGFDLIIGNPPYGVSIKGAYRDTIVKILNKVPDFEIYYFFINLAKKILKENGLKSYIIPNTILFNVFAKSYRENLFNEWQINEILDCTEFNVFEGSATVRCIITQFANKKSDDTVQYRPTANATTFQDLTVRPHSLTTKDVLLANNQNWALVFKLNSDVLNLISKIKKNTPLSNNYDVSQGYIPYRKSDLIKIYGEKKGKDIVEKREWHSETKVNNEYKQEIWGTNLSKFEYSKADSFIWYGKHLAGYVDPKYFNQTRLLVREITNPTIIACIVTEELVNDPQIISIIPKNDKADINLLWAIMNSKLATYYHFNSSPKATKGAFPKILVEDIKNFPIPTIENKNKDELLKLVKEINTAWKKKEETTEIETKINNLIYRIYKLNEDEIKLIEEK